LADDRQPTTDDLVPVSLKTDDRRLKTDLYNPSPMTTPVFLVHGGAWAIPDDMADAHRVGVRAACDAGWRILERGGSALDAVEAAIVLMEDDETFDAGRGSFLTADATVQLDALLMDGATLRAGGVGCVERIRNPIRAARNRAV
jgi:beta-aspartyl-peptidase (threonine type)